MTEFYKLIFDLALYYTLSGYAITLLFHRKPSVVGFLLLVMVVLADAILRGVKKTRDSRAVYLPLLMPLLIVIAKPNLCQIIQMFPAWVYLIRCITKSLVFTDYYAFRDHFSFGMKLLLLLFLGIPFWNNVSTPISGMLPYLILMLSDGVCLLRMLREQRRNGLQQGVYIGGFILLCAGLTVGKAPQLLLKGLSWLYSSVLAPLIFFLAIVLAVLGYWLYLILKWLATAIQGKAEPVELELASMADMLGMREQYETYTTDLTWLKMIMILGAAAVAVLVVFVIFRRLLGEKMTASAVPDRNEHGEKKIPQTGKARKPGLLRPRDPRLAVRYYFDKLVTESRKRGLEFSPGLTATELLRHSEAAFPSTNPEKLAALYALARYSSREIVTSEDADRAAAVWREVKQTKITKER